MSWPIPQDLDFRDGLVPFRGEEDGNDHYALIYETRAEQLAAAVPFIREGLERDEQCICVVDDSTDDKSVMEQALQAGGVDLDATVEAGDLIFYTVQETYLRQDSFDPDEMIAFYADLIENVNEEYDGLRVSAATDWLDRIDIESFMEYEGRINKLFEETNSMALCHYNRAELPARVIRDVIHTHPHLIFDDTVCENVYYIPPDELFGPEQPDREVERMISTLKARRRAKADLETSHERLEEFASAVSHDLREPLGTVANYLQLLERRYETELDEDAQDFIDFAINGATRTREMIDGLVTTYAHVESAGDPFEPVELDTVLEDILLDLDAKIEATDAVITSEPLPDVAGDRGQLRHLLLNLVDNAIKFSGDEAPHVHINAQDGGEMCEISVSDEGIGMPPTATENVFGVFTRAHSKEEYPGTGIGLALCDRIVERHGGDIWVESEPDQGSTFRFTLPTGSARPADSE